MGATETLAAVREKYPQYKDMNDAELGSALAAKYPAYADLAPKAPIAGYDWSKPETYKDPAALLALKEQSRQGGVLVGTEKPRDLGESALAAVGSIPWMVGPLPAQMATTGVRSLMRGEDVPHALVDVAGAGVGGLALKAAGKVASKISGPADALAWIRERIGKGADGAVNNELLDGLIAWWQKQPTAAAKEAVGEKVVQNLRDNFGKEVAQMFRRQILRGTAHVPGVPAVRGQVPLGVAEKARGVVQGTESDLARAATTAVSGTPSFSGIAATLANDLARPVARHIPGGREVSETIEEATGE